MNNIERRYIQNLDRPADDEIRKQGLLAEQMVADFFNSSEAFQARLSTKTEDSGAKDIGNKPTIDIVAYDKDGHPAIGIQVTSALDKKTQAKKMQELKDHPFVRIPELGPRDSAIPKALVFFDRDKAPDQVPYQIIEGIILSLKFDLTQTKNPQEILAVKSLISKLEQERKRYTN